jgi:hypothetical protein
MNFSQEGLSKGEGIISPRDLISQKEEKETIDRFGRNDTVGKQRSRRYNHKLGRTYLK